MVRRFRNHGLDERQLIDTARELRQQGADPLATLAMAAEGERALEQPAGLAEKGVDLTLAGQLAAVVLRQVGLVVERINVADPATAKDLDDALGLGWEVSWLWGVG